MGRAALGGVLLLVVALGAATPASARLTDSFVTTGKAQARWIHESEAPPGATGAESIELAVRAQGPFDFNDAAWVAFRGFASTAPATPPSFHFRTSQVGNSGGSVRLVIRFSDGGFGFLRPLTLTDRWTLADGALANWESHGGRTGCGGTLSYTAMLACHPGTTVTSLEIINDSGWLYNGRFETLVDNIRYGDEIVTRPAPPVLGASLNVAGAGGKVLVRQPSSPAGQAQARGRRPSDLDRVDGIVQGLPVGSTVDARRGTVRLSSAKGRGRGRQAGRFSGAIFKVGQIRRGRGRGLTTLRMETPSRRRCNTRRARRSSSDGGPLADTARHRRRGLLRRLRGRARGRFRTRGRYSSAIVRGTRWTTEDRCEGTLVRVHEGKVAVRDRRRRHTILVRAGQKYLARAPGY